MEPSDKAKASEASEASEATEESVVVLRYVTSQGKTYFVRGPEMVFDVPARVTGDVASARIRDDPIDDVAVLTLSEEQFQALPNREESERLFPSAPQ